MRVVFRFFECVDLVEKSHTKTMSKEVYDQICKEQFSPPLITEWTDDWYEWPDKVSKYLPYRSVRHWGELPKTEWEHQIIWESRPQFIAVRNDIPQFICWFWWVWIRVELTLDIWFNK